MSTWEGLAVAENCRKVWLIVVSLVLALAAAPVPAQAQSAAPGAATSEQRSFDIPAQPLTEALILFGRQAGLQASTSPSLVQNLRSAPVKGVMTWQEALSTLLAGTGLTYRLTGSLVTLERAVVQPDDGPMRLDPVTVTGARFATPISEVPTAITVVDRDEIQSNPVFGRNIQAGISQSVPGATLTDTRGTSVSIRGRSVSYRINGVEINQRGRASDIAVQDLAGSAFESIDVVRGTDSTFGFGFDGGAINFRTPQPTPGEAQFITQAGIDFQTEDFEDSLGYRFRQEVTGTWNRFGYAIGGGARFSGTQFDPEGDPYPDTLSFNRTNADVFDVNATLTFALDDDQSLETTQYFFYTENDPKFTNGEPGDVASGDKATSQPVDADAFDNLREENRQYVTTFTYRHDDLWGNRVNLTGFYQENDQENVFDTPGTVVGTFDEGNRRYGALSSVQTPFWLLDNTLLQGAAVTWGVDYQDYAYLRTEVSGPEPQNQVFPEIVERLIAGHVQATVPIGDVLDLTGGLRHERGEASLDDLEDRPNGGGDFEGGDLNFDTTLYNAGLTLHVTDAFNVYGSFSQSAGLLDFGRGSVLVSRAEDLEPELDPTNQYEVGLRGDFEQWQFTAAAFYSESDLGQVFVRDPALDVAVPLTQPLEIWGIELTLDTQPLEELRVGGTFSFSEGQTEQDDGSKVALSHLTTQPPKLTGYVDYAPVSWLRTRLTVTHQFAADSQNDLIATGQQGGQPLDPKTFVNFFARIEPGFLPGEIDLGIENLLDQKEFDVAAEGRPNDERYYLYPARTFTIAYRLRW